MYRLAGANRSLLPLLAIACALFLFVATPRAVHAESKDVLKESNDILEDLDSGKKQGDAALIRLSHLSMIETWQGVRPEPETKDDKQKYHWAMTRGFASPLDAEPISTPVQVPEKGTYRVYLRHVLGADETRPVTLRITSEGSVAPLVHEYGTIKLLERLKGREQEAHLPIRVESELQLNTFPDRQTPVWEYWDVPLTAGVYRLSLESKKSGVQVGALFMTQSLGFRPSFAPIAKDNTLQKIFMRFRLVDPTQRPVKFGVAATLTYHWRGRPMRNGEDMWGHAVGAVSDVPGDAWTPFIDATDAVVPGPGPWSTCNVDFQNVRSGKAEVQFAWAPSDAGVLKTLTSLIGGGRLMFRVPHGPLQYTATADNPRWGIWNPGHIAAVEPEEKIVERYFTWASDAAKELGLKEDHPKPKELLFLSSCRVGEGYRERASEMLAKLGVNWIEGAPKSVVDRLGLYNGSTMTKIKVGDEIGTYTPASVVNGNPAMLAGFHRYLREQAALQGTTAAEMFGVENLDTLRCLPALPDNPGRFERRLYYHSHRYGHIATIPEYAKAVRAAEAEHKNAAVYNNYSPHPVFLTGNTMNESDWFLLARAGAQTLGWGEDWAGFGSWGLWSDRTQCVSFYAAMVECSVRKRGYSAGFYVGTNMGNSANKIFSCVAQGINIMHLYDWGPIDGWAEGSNAWSENQGEYKAVMLATHALGPADTIIAKGRREPRRTAVLYNRSHEIMNGQTVTLNHDWMWTYFAMKSAQVPVDVVIEEDLNPKDLARYQVLYLGGLNLEKHHLRAIAEWVKQGGLLIGSGGAAMYDAYNDLNPEAVELFGAKQALAPPSEASEKETVTFDESGVYPAAKFAVGSPAGFRYTLEPTTAKPLGRYDDGRCAAVSRQVEKGRTILLGFYPGYAYRASGDHALGPVQPWFNKPVRAKLGRAKAEFSYAASEVTLFEHASGIAVMVANFAPANVKLSTEPTKLSVQTDREIHEVISGLRGPIPWKRIGDRIEVQLPSPAELNVDTIILR
jgi:hypothetical protein